MPIDDPDQRLTAEIPATIGDLARLNGELLDLRDLVRDQAAELGALREQMEAARDEIRSHAVTTVIGGKTIRITLLIQAGD